MMDLSKLPNPYDFANPVNEQDLFIGRTTEMDEIKYYLDHASKASRAINLAIMGARASGKTSILNMIQIEAEKRGFCVVRVDLDEADAETQLAFFYKIFDSILTTAADLFDAYSGLTGKTYDIYLNIVNAYEVPNDKTFCPFVFPIQYAKAMNKGNIGAALSDTVFKRDIKSIQKELDRPIAVLFDECDVLTRSRVHLEKLRNIFMNTPGFMLVFTGTPALFPLMDDIFSPIVRQFKKINVGPFDEEDETEDCIRKPLEKIGISDPSEIFDFETYRDVCEIHELTGGRPYEIQLICHFLFRRIQEGRAKRMELTIDVLDDVLEELETSQDVSSRPIITAIRNFNKQQLSALRLLCTCNGRANFEQIWFSEYVLWGENEWTKELLQEHLRRFEEVGVVTIEDNIINFAGDDFDRIYCKYLARKSGVLLSIDDLPYELFLTIRLHSFLLEKSIKIQPSLTAIVGGIEKPEIKDIAMALLSDSKSADPFELTPDIAEELYWYNLNFRDRDSFQIAIVILTTPWITMHLWFSQDPNRAAKSSLNELTSILAGPSERAAAVGGDLKVEIHTLPVVPVEKLIRKVEQSGNVMMKSLLSEQHYNKMISAYIRRHDIEESFFHGELAYRYDPKPIIISNLGYLHLVSDNLQKARELLERAMKDYEKSEDSTLPDSALPNYNLGVVEAREGNLEGALARFKLAIEQIEAAEKEDRACACLVLPKIAGGEKKLEFQELSGPDLLETARSAASAVEELLSKE